MRNILRSGVVLCVFSSFFLLNSCTVPSLNNSSLQTAYPSSTVEYHAKTVSVSQPPPPQFTIVQPGSVPTVVPVSPKQ